MNLLAFRKGTTLKVQDSGSAAAHIATHADVEAWANNRDLILIPKAEWLKLTQSDVP